MINYPAGTGPKRGPQPSKKQTNYGSRGMSLEEQLNSSNAYYLTHNKAVIHKKPTPIQVVHVDYPKRSAARITEAYYRHASTTDYNGVYRGYYIDFEAKETTNKTRFPLSNLPLHQRDHMEACHSHGGVAFMIISFTHYNEVYLLPFPAIKTYIESTTEQSLSYTYIQESGYLCPRGVFPMIDYLQALDDYLLSFDTAVRKDL